MEEEARKDVTKGVESTRSMLNLQHHRQKYNWDCGVSCVLMVLPEQQRRDFLINFNKICHDEGFDKSTWTIDLCYLLHRFKLHHRFCTITLGIQPGYTGQAFYSKILNKDQGRVTRRFAEASDKGLQVEERSISEEELVQHLSQSGPVILLTNANLLHCLLCKANRLSSELRSCLPWANGYQGHYIVLCGYDVRRKLFYYRNPSFRDRVCAMNFTSLNEARVSYGTDEDAIMIYAPHIGTTDKIIS